MITSTHTLGFELLGKDLKWKNRAIPILMIVEVIEEHVKMHKTKSDGSKPLRREMVTYLHCIILTVCLKTTFGWE